MGFREEHAPKAMVIPIWEWSVNESFKESVCMNQMTICQTQCVDSNQFGTYPIPTYSKHLSFINVSEKGHKSLVGLREKSCNTDLIKDVLNRPSIGLIKNYRNDFGYIAMSTKWLTANHTSVSMSSLNQTLFCCVTFVFSDHLLRSINGEDYYIIFF